MWIAHTSYHGGSFRRQRKCRSAFLLWLSDGCGILSWPEQFVHPSPHTYTQRSSKRPNTLLRCKLCLFDSPLRSLGARLCLEKKLTPGSSLPYNLEWISSELHSLALISVYTFPPCLCEGNSGLIPSAPTWRAEMWQDVASLIPYYVIYTRSSVRSPPFCLSYTQQQ